MGNFVFDPLYDGKCRVFIDAPGLMPGWGCCFCLTYNGLQRDICKRCGHDCCKEKPMPHELGLCDTCGVPDGMAHVGHQP